MPASSLLFMMIIAQAAVVALIGSCCGYEGHCVYVKYLKGVCGCILACQVLLVKCCFSSADYQVSIVVLYFKYFCGSDYCLSTVRVLCLG